MNLNLPKPYLSKSQISLWRSSPSQYKKRYFENQPLFTTKEMRFGTEFEENLLQTQTEILTEYENISLRGFMDFFSEDRQICRDDKTGKKPWTPGRVENSDDRKFYSLAIKQAYGFVPIFQLDWYETAEDERGQIYHTDRKETFEFGPMEEEEIKAYGQEILSIAKEISDAYTQFQTQQKDLLNIDLIDQYSSLNKEIEAKKKELEKVKKQIQLDFEANGVRDFANSSGSFYYTTRKKWNYSDEIKAKEKELKDLKKKEEQSGKIKYSKTESFSFRKK